MFEDIVGLTIEEALPKVAERGITAIRPRDIDGKAMMGTMDMRTDRLNVSIDYGVITGVGRVG